MTKLGEKMTVFVCSYNSPFLKRCLDSLAVQSISGSLYKVLLINDGSCDNSFEIASSYSKRLKNLRILNNRKNTGLISCCNQGLNIIDTPYFMRLDADDCLSSNAMEEILNELDSSKKSAFIIFKRWDVYKNRLEEVEISDDIYSWIAAGTVFDTEVVRTVDGYSEEYWEEYDLYLKLIASGYKYKLSASRIYYYHREQKGITGDAEKKKKGTEDLLTKWGAKVLNRYGNFKKFLEYYGI